MTQPTRVFAIGASMGGYEALQALVAQLPPDFPACLCIVLHVHRDAPGILAGTLAGAGPLDASTAQDGEPLRPGHVLVCPPDRHLMVEEDRVRVTLGPKENRVRPSIDVLLRSAALAQGDRAVGVLLTGLLDDGVAGLSAIERCGGVTIVQDPDDADYAELPQNACDEGLGGHRVPLAGMGELLTRLATTPVPLAERCADEHLAYEVSLAHGSLEPTEPAGGQLVPFVCTDCGGPLWEQDDPHGSRYRCHTGHAFTAETLLSSQDEAFEQSMWVAVRTLEGRAAMLVRLAREMDEKERRTSAQHYRDEAEQTRRHASELRRVLFAAVGRRQEGRQAPAGDARERQAAGGNARPVRDSA